MGPEDSGKKKVKFYMMVNGQSVEIEPDFAEIKYTEDRQGDDNLALNNCELSVWVKLPRSMRCKSRKRFVKLLMASGIQRNVAQVLARGYVVWSNRLPIPACLKASYQSYYTDLWMRGVISVERR